MYDPTILNWWLNNSSFARSSHQKFNEQTPFLECKTEAKKWERSQKNSSLALRIRYGDIWRRFCWVKSCFGPSTCTRTRFPISAAPQTTPELNQLTPKWNRMQTENGPKWVRFGFWSRTFGWQFWECRKVGGASVKTPPTDRPNTFYLQKHPK